MAQTVSRDDDAVKVQANDEVKYHYIEKDRELTEEHLILFKELQQYREDILSKKIEWLYHEIEDHWKIEPIDFEAIFNENDNNEQTDDSKTDNNTSLDNTDDVVNDSKTSDNENSNTDTNSNTNSNTNTNTGNNSDKNIAKPEFYDYFTDYCTNETLLRHLVGGDYQIEKAKQSLLQTVEWRVLSSIDKIVPQQFETVLKCEAVYCLNKFDKMGHPICYFKILEEPLKDPWYLVKCAVFTVEKALRFCDMNDKYQCVWIIDLEHLKYGTMPPIAVMREIAHVLHYYYPERLHCAYIVHAALVFRMAWNLISSLLTENTKNKIKFISWNDSTKFQTYSEIVDKDNLESVYGGTDETKYSYQWELESAKKNKYYRKLDKNTPIK